MANNVNIISKFVRTQLSTGHYIYVGGKSVVSGVLSDNVIYRPLVDTADAEKYGLIDITAVFDKHLYQPNGNAEKNTLPYHLAYLLNANEQIKSRLTDIDTAIDEVEQDIATLTENVEQTQTDLSSANQSIAKYSAKTLKLEQDLTALADSVGEIETQAENAEAVAIEAKTTANDLKPRVNQLETSVDLHKDYITNHINRITYLEDWKLDKSPVVGQPLIDADTNKINSSYLPQGVSEVKGGNLNSQAMVTLTGNGQTALGTTASIVTLVNAPTSQVDDTFGYQQTGSLYFVADGTFTLFGIDFEVGDWLTALATGWSKIANVDAVTSVNGQTGDVHITPQSLNVYTKEETDELLGDYIDSDELSEATKDFLTSADLNDYAKTADLSAYVPTTRTVNGKPLSADVTIPVSTTTKKTLTQTSANVASSTTGSVTTFSVADTSITSKSYVIVEPTDTATETFLSEYLSSAIVTTTAGVGFSFNLTAPLPSTWAMTYYVTEVV